MKKKTQCLGVQQNTNNKHCLSRVAMRALKNFTTVVLLLRIKWKID
jgi:hypothetical protein